jgi:hypothetical protein
MDRLGTHRQGQEVNVKRVLSLSGVIGMLAATTAVAAQPAKAPPASASAPQQGQVAPVPVPRTEFIATMDREFRAMDANKDGILTRQEIEQFQRAQATAQAQAQNRALFARLDTDHNGQLSPAEFVQLPVTIPAPNAAPVLAQSDLNKDQSISLVEWRTAKLANFDRLDTDKDGVVSVAEMRAGGIVK